jgi:hypothetical protein
MRSMRVLSDPWLNAKDASRTVAGSDQSVFARVKCIADVGAAGNQADQSTVAIAGDVITIQIAEGGGALANEALITYTGQAGAAGTITITDGNANTPLEVVNILNGVGAGQTAFRRFRAALGDVRPGYAFLTGHILAQAAANILLGRSDNGFELFLDTSGLAAGALTDGIFLGIGTDGGCIEGSGATWPDYFEDIPGSSTTASVNTPTRSSARRPRKYHDATTRQLQYRITGFSASFLHATTEVFNVWDINDNLIYQEALTANAITAFQDRSETPIVGPVGSPLFCLLGGTGGETDGFLSVQAEVRAV